MHAFSKFGAGAATVLAAVGALTVAGSTAATADTNSVVYSCGSGSQTQQFDERITITAPTDASVGDSIVLDVSVQHDNQAQDPFPAGSITAELDVTVGGAVSDEVTATGLTNEDRVPAGDAPLLTGGQAEVTVPNAGDVTFTPDTFTVVNNGVAVSCTPAEAAPVIATTHVS
ncbi:hypothetical protein J2S53_003511 [Actinopolyspora lacussalsi]|nr:hypothetical protein [Actinopolyspora lacussalsi]